jgi:hypothetical protein
MCTPRERSDRSANDGDADDLISRAPVLDDEAIDVLVEGRPDLVWTYSYDAGGNLQTVLAPGSAAWRTHEYASRTRRATSWIR